MKTIFLFLSKPGVGHVSLNVVNVGGPPVLVEGEATGLGIVRDAEVRPNVRVKQVERSAKKVQLFPENCIRKYF